jgi:hypothetical protein
LLPSAFQHRLGQFLDKQWDTVGVRNDLRNDIGGDRGIAGQLFDQRRAVAFVETIERKTGNVGATTPGRLSAVRLRRRLASIALSRNAGAYCSSPSLRNQSVISIDIVGIATSSPTWSCPPQRGEEYHAPNGRSVTGFTVVRR